jgi:hypothetical protein
MKYVSPVAAILIAASVLTSSVSIAEDVTPKWEYVYHSVVPLGEETILLQPGNHALSFLAAAESIGFEGWRQIYRSDSSILLAADGSRVERYPRFVDFRVAVSARPRRVRRPQPLPQPLLVDCESQCMNDANQFLLHLRFRVKIFRALHVTVLEPKVVRLVGTPGSDEHVYRVSFDLGEVPLADRIVLEVLAPGGERLTKFHLDM